MFPSRIEPDGLSREESCGEKLWLRCQAERSRAGAGAGAAGLTMSGAVGSSGAAPLLLSPALPGHTGHHTARSRETDWALGGAALGLTVALVEYIATNVFERRADSEFASRRGDIRPYARRKHKPKFKDILEDIGADRSEAFGYSDYNDAYRNVLREHYRPEYDYDYEDYSYSNMFRDTFPHSKTLGKQERESNKLKRRGPDPSPRFRKQKQKKVEQQTTVRYNIIM